MAQLDFILCHIFRKSSHKNTYGEGTSRRGRHDSDDSDQEMFEKYKDFMFAPDELPIYMANPKVPIISKSGNNNISFMVYVCIIQY